MARYVIEQELHPNKWWKRRPVEQRLADLRLPSRFGSCDFTSLTKPLPVIPGTQTTYAEYLQTWADGWSGRNKKDRLEEFGRGVVLYNTDDDPEATKHLIAALRDVVTNNQSSGCYTTATQLVESYWYGKDQEADTSVVDPHFYYNLRNTWSLVLLDGLGMESRTEFSQQVVNQVLRDRFTACRPTLVTTPLNPDTLVRVYGLPIKSSLVENADCLPWKA